MRDAKLCPHCGFLLRYEDPPDPSFGALRYVGIELLPWAALALFLAALWGPDDVKEWTYALAFAVAAAWLWQRPKQRARTRALLARRRYSCAQCKREYTGADLT
jgi:hypothetical protein